MSKTLKKEGGYKWKWNSYLADGSAAKAFTKIMRVENGTSTAFFGATTRDLREAG